jgi:hypothetical protein
MELRDLGPDGQTALDQALGYLNFSTGTEDASFLANLSLLQGRIAPCEAFGCQTSDETSSGASLAPYQRLIGRLRHRLEEVAGNSAAFQDTEQVRRVLDLLEHQVLPGYRAFHRDLLFHQSDARLFRPYFLGRVCEAILRHQNLWDAPERLVRQVVRELNDYVGYRPVAVLEERALKPYPHEMVRPLPLYVQGAGVESGPYRRVVEQALDFLRQTDPRILRMAHFDPANLHELAIDPRAYDFDHPVNKRPNYHFGLWDPQIVDNHGNYTRFVVQEVTLNALMSRIDSAASEAPHHELEREAAAVLSGTILMASGVSGTGPGAHSSNATLGNLLPGIAAYRDAFYEHLIGKLMKVDPPHAQRLQQEARRLRQPFGAARQHLNGQLTRSRASQLERVRLATLFARMGQPAAAQRQLDAVPVASARMVCQIDCHLAIAKRKIDEGHLAESWNLMRECRELLARGIDCGAILDPWNILGFDGNFSLFPAMENTVHDHRVDELVELVEEIFDTYGRVWSTAAAENDREVGLAVAHELEDFAHWWHQFAAHEVSSIQTPDALELFHATENVARALEQWHQAGEATGDIRFWAPYVEEFDSPKAYAMVVSMLLDRRDSVAARGLLVHWLGQSETVALEQGEDSFHHLALRWLVAALKLSSDQPDGEATAQMQPVTQDDWQRVIKFFDYLEANAGSLWKVPAWDPSGDASQAQGGSNGNGSANGSAGGHDDHRTTSRERGDRDADEELDDDDLDEEDLEDELDDERDPDEDGDDDGCDEDEEGEELFGAAYEGVVYRDSTDDGMEGSVYDGSTTGSEDAWDVMHDHVLRRLAFLNTLSRLRRVAAVAWMLQGESLQDPGPIQEHLQSWAEHAMELHDGLEDLLLRVWRQRLQRPSQDFMSVAEFDRERVIKESLMEHVIAACVEAKQSAFFAAGALGGDTDALSELSSDEQLAIRLLRSALRGRSPQASTPSPSPSSTAWNELRTALRKEPVLYVPLSRGGNPRSIVSIRGRQQLLRTLLNWLPRLGMLTETRALVDIVRQMERNVPAGPGAITEFDDLFEVGFRGLADSIICAQDVNERVDLGPSDESHQHGPSPDSSLECLTESMLVSWLSHSRTLRLSVLEKVKAAGPWQDLVDFVKRFGGDLFTQQFLSLANIRSILYQGVDVWLEQMLQDPPEDEEPRLLQELDSHLSREEATHQLGLVLEAIVENYAEYRDYNSTTTQSDRGDLLYNLLDFLRLLSNYERVVWNLKPVVLVHEQLVRRGREEAATLWRAALADRIAEEADRYQERMAKLQQRYAMRLPTIADRIGERFQRPLVIDRIRALVKPSMEHPEGREFEMLEREALELAREPSGVGFEAPAWLLGLEDEVRRVRRGEHVVDDQQLMEAILPMVTLTIKEVQQQIESWTAKDE